MSAAVKQPPFGVAQQGVRAFTHLLFSATHTGAAVGAAKGRSLRRWGRAVWPAASGGTGLDSGATPNPGATRTALALAGRKLSQLTLASQAERNT